MSEHELAWMAGVLEGEGNIYVSEPNDKTIGVTAISVANCDRTIVEPFSERYGGAIRCSNPNRPDHWTEVHRWEAAATKITRPLCELRPYIHSPDQRERIDLALKIQAVKTRWPVPMEERDDYRTTLRSLVHQLRGINDLRG